MKTFKEMIKVDIKVGDTVLGGKFKNKNMVQEEYRTYFDIRDGVGLSVGSNSVFTNEFFVSPGSKTYLDIL